MVAGDDVTQETLKAFEDAIHELRTHITAHQLELDHLRVTADALRERITELERTVARLMARKR